MHLADIPIFPTVTGPSSFINDNREEAPEFLRLLIEKHAGIDGVSSLEAFSDGDITILLGGKMSLIYALRVEGRWVVVKFRSRGGLAEAQALRAWNRVGASVVCVLANGVIREAGGGKEAVKYMVMEAVVDPQNRIARTAQEYLGDHPEEAREVARPLGEALAEMHRASAGTDFGEFADMDEKKDGKESPQSWASYLVGYLRQHHRDLLRLGFPPPRLHALRERIGGMAFPGTGVVLHGDFSARNSALVAHAPYQIKVFDPNPIIGHPSWDLAIIENNVDFSRRRLEHAPDRQDLRTKLQVEEGTLEGVLQGYARAGGEPCSGEEIAAAQLMQCLYLLPQKVFKAKRRGKSLANDTESQVVRDTMAEKIDLLTRE
jgi:fructosamine-3-kinase